MPSLAVICAFVCGLVVSGLLSVLIGFSGDPGVVPGGPAQRIVTSSSEAVAAFPEVSVSGRDTQADADRNHQNSGTLGDPSKPSPTDATASQATKERAPLTHDQAVLKHIIQKLDKQDAPPVHHHSAPNASQIESGDTPLTGQQAALNRLINAASGLYNASTKAGMLPGKLWHPDYGGDQGGFDKQLFAWLEDHYSVRMDKEYPRTDPLERAPKSHNCVVAINPAYKVIYLKLPKTAGTSVVAAMGGWCKKANGRVVSKDWDAQGPCFWRMNFITAESPGFFGYSTWEAMWMDYTVFTVVRNPYDRAGSAYDYLLQLRKERIETHPGCMAPTFEHFCGRAYFLGVQDMLFHCTDHSIQAKNHNFFHVEPQSDCLFNEGGKPVFDHLLRLGHIDEDYAELAKLLNKKRPWRSPAFSTEVREINIGKRARGVPSADKPNKHLGKYVACGDACFENVRKYYEHDFDLLKFPVATQDL